MESLTKKIKYLLSDPKELDKKQVALFLTQDKIDELDNIVKSLTTYSTKRISRNELIELAIDDLIEHAPIALKEYMNEYYKNDDNFNLIICPSDFNGLDTVYSEKKWYHVRISEEKIPKIAWCAWYLGSPTKAITHYCKVKEIKRSEEPFNDKWTIYLEGDPIKLEHEVVLGDMNAMGVRSNKFVNLNTLLRAREYSDLK